MLAAQGGWVGLSELSHHHEPRLMARQPIEAGVRMVQVNLGNDETRDTHEAAFRNLREFLFPPTDRAVSAVIDDLHERGLLDDVLIVIAGEFGRTTKRPAEGVPAISLLNLRRGQLKSSAR